MDVICRGDVTDRPSFVVSSRFFVLLWHKQTVAGWLLQETVSEREVSVQGVSKEAQITDSCGERTRKGHWAQGDEL